MSQTEPTMPPAPPADMRSKLLINFGLFGLFFVFYVGAALLQTPLFKDLAVIPVAGMPIGLVISMAVFPVSWIILVIWFRRAR